MATVFINEDRLTAIGDAIRAKTGDTALLKVVDMPSAIEGITTGGGGALPEEVYCISGACDALFGTYSSSWTYTPHWNWFIEMDGVYTKDITTAIYMFQNNSTLKEIPFDLNFIAGQKHGFAYVFENCYSLERIGTIRNVSPENCARLFSGCRNLRELPVFENLDMSSWNTNATGMGQTFNGCYSLRKVSPEFLSKWWNQAVTSGSSCMYYRLFYNNYTLDEIVGLMPAGSETKTTTSNMFSSSTFDYCHRIKNMTFATQADGSVYIRPWGSQSINLAGDTYNRIGFANPDDIAHILNYNSGINADKEVKDAETYAALKNDDDWFSLNAAYSRYNHDSAVNTINSLPDTTTGAGSNTIRFLGESGSATDGGAINTLTEAEIAVAAAKGWTVTLV